MEEITHIGNYTNGREPKKPLSNRRIYVCEFGTDLLLGPTISGGIFVDGAADEQILSGIINEKDELSLQDVFDLNRKIVNLFSSKTMWSGALPGFLNDRRAGGSPNVGTTLSLCRDLSENARLSPHKREWCDARGIHKEVATERRD